MIQIIFGTLLVLVMLGCAQQTKQASLGPQVNPDQVALMVEKRLVELDPYRIQQGQMVHKIESQELVTSQGPIKNYAREWLTDVTEVELKKGNHLVTTVKKVKDFGTDPFVYEFKNVYAFPQLTTSKYLAQLSQTNEGTESLSSALHQASDQKDVAIVGIAYHNLKEREISMVPPALVKKDKDCRGIKGCRIPGYLITHDIVFLLSDGTRQTHNVEWYISPAVPFFAGILKQCSSALVPIDQLRVLIKQCREVVDFSSLPNN